MAGIAWTEEEDNVLIEFYPHSVAACCLRLPRRTSSAIMNRASVLGLTSQEKRGTYLRTYWALLFKKKSA